MKRPLTIAMASAAFVAASAMAWADNTYYALSAPRIIVVPQPGDDMRRTQASLPAADDVDDEVEAAPRPQPAVRSAVRPATPSRTQPKKADSKEPLRRKPFAVSLPEPPPSEPEPTGPRRALLSAPPPPPTSSIHDGPTPLRPTPRFGQPLPEAPPPLTTFTPPPRPVAAAAPAPEPVAASALPLNAGDDDLPPPGDPRLAPPEPKD